MKIRINKLICSIVSIACVFSVLSITSNTNVNALTNEDAATIAQDFVDAYWDPQAKYFYCNSDHSINPQHNPGPENGLYTDYWWEAQLWETVMDIYEQSNSAQYYEMIGDVYDGFLMAYPDWSKNEFNDDIGWWALACLRAYDITGEIKYAETSKEMFDFVFDNQWSSDFGGGIWWNRIGFLPQKNVATNGTASIIAMRLSGIFTNDTYDQKAELLYNWVRETFYNSNTGKVSDNIKADGVYDWEYTYNSGIFAAAAYEMFLHTGDTAHRDDAFKAADWAIDYMTLDGILIYEGEDDCPGFKMIFSRFLKEIAEQENRVDYIEFLKRNAAQAYSNRRISDGLIGPDHNTTPRETEVIQSLAAAAGVSIVQLGSPNDYVGNIDSGVRFEAENTRRYGVNNENTNTGYEGRGYTAGWNDTDTKIVFAYNADQAGVYQLTFRHSAAAGNATRTVKVNDKIINDTQMFLDTSDWNVWDYSQIEVFLPVGKNKIELGYYTGNSNYLNVDYIEVNKIEHVAMIEAEEGTLHNLSSENYYGDYLGTGYVAGWNGDGQYVDLPTTISESGRYTLFIRYSLGNGSASRQLYVNGNTVESNIVFPGGYDWNDYYLVKVDNVYLNAGQNTISLIYSESLGSTNWLNYDSLIIVK